ncbi:SDR family NAD(P)-dependent oxidoreductase [Dactylosporangium sp. CA-092794]|uniref:SDR family NAD(P)-dependent oxidoreductase n=1 Tax=Dactylosporangium sp. CA-092794 TaxID=3239929 RepID=UPI003D8CC094
MKSIVVIGATQGTGRELAAEYARRGARVVITGRSAERAEEVAAGIDGDVTGLALDLTRPAEIGDALKSVESVDRVAVVGMVRDVNTLADYDVARAVELSTTKVVGYTTVAAVLRERMTPDASVLLFGGLAKDYPYPGSTTLTAVNAALVGVVRTLSVELAPVRVNSIHPGGIEDSPFWQDKPEALEFGRKQTLTGRLGTMRDIVDGCVFLLENPFATGINLSLDGGRH